jgi:SnoaL-like domain
MTAVGGSELEATAAFLDAVARRDYDAIAALFAPEARLRALVPTTVRDDVGPEAIAARYRFWYGDLEHFALLETDEEAVGDRIRLRYRVRGTDPDEGPIVQEQTAYATVEDGRITVLNLVCSGSRPAP